MLRLAGIGVIGLLCVHIDGNLRFLNRLHRACACLLYTSSLGTKEAEAILPKVLEKIRTYRPEQIFVTQDTHPDNYLERCV